MSARPIFHSIVNVTSSNAVAVAEQRSEYCASKAAASMVSKALAVRLGRENVAVYDVQPGLISTEMTAPVIEAYRERSAQGLTLFPRVGEPAEVGTLIASLATGRLPLHNRTVDPGRCRHARSALLRSFIMKITLPDTTGRRTDYVLTGMPITAATLGKNPARVVYSAAHVVADPFTANDPSGRATVDWEKTMEFRRYLASLGLGIAEAMDTAQRGMGLDWVGALELMRRTREELPDALVANGCGTDHLDPAAVTSLDDVRGAYLKQAGAIQSFGGRLILMASRALVRVAKRPEDYIKVYSDVLTACDEPVILHWLGDMFDSQLAGYWGNAAFEPAMQTALDIIEANTAKVDGIKISLLDKEKEIVMRLRRLPAGVKMYTGDDFSYPELIEGDDEGFSHALLGIFDPPRPLLPMR